MAYVTSNTHDGRYLKLTVVEESYSIENNTSTIRWTFESIGGNVNYYGIYNWGVKVGNETVYDIQTTEWSAKTFPAAKGSRTGTITVEHNPDGSASDITFHLYGVVYNGGTADHSGSISLTTIPRASSVSFDNGNNPTLTTNNPYGITISMASSSFSHKLYWSLGNATYQLIAEKSAGVETHSWLVSRNLAQQITNSTLSGSGAGTLICETYNGSTLIGTKTCNFTLSVDSGIVPTLSSSSMYDGNSEVSEKNWGVYLKNKSYVQVSITGSNSDDQGATISRYWCTYEGVTYSDTSVSNLNLQLANKALVVGNNKTLTVGVTDTRGRTASANKTYTVVDYYSPSINSYSAYRSNSSGAIADDIYFRYALNCSISSCGNRNPMTIIIKWRIKGSSTDTGTATIKNRVTNESSYNSNGVLGDSNHPIGTNNTYEIIFEVSDAFTTNTRSVDIGPIFELFHFHANGKAVAFGKKSGAGNDEELFEVNMPTILDDIKRLRNNHEAGFEWDIYGNWKHMRNESNDIWSMSSYDGTHRLSIYPETGYTTVNGSLHVNADVYSDGIGVNLSDVGYRFDGRSISNTNLNNLNSNSLYYAGSGNTNVPCGSWMECLTMGNGGQDAAQLGIYVSNGQLYTRGKANGNWGSWKWAIMNEYLGTGKDLNNYKDSGHYGLYGSNSNSPTSSICVLEVAKYSGDWVIQRVTTIEQFPREWIRCFYSGTTWGTWGRVMHEKTIYESSGTNGNITLDYGLDNFDEIEIFIKDNGYGGISSKRFKTDLYTLYRLDVIDTYTSGSTPHFEIRGCQYTVTNTTTLTRVSNQYFHVQNKTISGASLEAHLYVYKIVGYY